MNLSSNVTERRRKEDRLRWMVESAPNALIMVDSEGKIVMVNARAETLFGYSRSQMIGLAIEQLIPTGFINDQTDQPEMQAMGMGREIFCVKKDGQEIPIEIGLNPMKTTEGSFVVASIVDITERRKAELEVARQRQELAHLSRVELMSQFSGSLAHELNQPLSAMMTNSQVAARILAQPNPDIEELRTIMLDIIADNRRAAEIVIRLRSWLKKEQHSFSPHNLNDLLTEAIHFLRTEFMFQNLECKLELLPELPNVLCDRVQIQQVLVNLLKNAWESIQSQPINPRQVIIRTALSFDGQVEVQVQDDGDGIPESQLKDLFHPFLTTKEAGLGIGLSICHAIIENHKGRIWAENNPGRGATFHFVLPAVKEDRS